MRILEPAHPPLCVITNHPARYRDPVTGLPYRNSGAFKEIQRLRRGEYKWSRLLGAWVGSGTVAAKGVPAAFLGGEPSPPTPPPPRPQQDQPNQQRTDGDGEAKAAAQPPPAVADGRRPEKDADEPAEQKTGIPAPAPAPAPTGVTPPPAAIAPGQAPAKPGQQAQSLVGSDVLMTDASRTAAAPPLEEQLSAAPAEGASTSASAQAPAAAV